MQKTNLEVKIEHDFDEKIFKHQIIAEALNSIEQALHEGNVNGSVGKVRKQGSYEAVWNLKDKGEVEA